MALRTHVLPTIPCRLSSRCSRVSVTLCVFTLGLLCLSTDVVRRMETYDIITQTLGSRPTSSRGHLVHSPGCRIPHMDPRDPSAQQFIDPYPPITCHFKPAFTSTDRMYLRINESVMHEHYTTELLHCEYQQVYRSAEGGDNVYLVNKTVIKFTGDVMVDCDYIRVVCYDHNYSMIYTNFHAFIRPVKMKTVTKTKDNKRPNILMVGLDSVSRLNFLRQMPETKELLSQMGAMDLQGYNKVADNTLVNLMPMFTGHFLHDLQKDKFLSLDYFDDYPFVWKEFQKLGYKTLFGEDAPQISIFNYMRQGFRKQPMDYYLRPFSLVIEEHTSLWNNDHDCFRDTPETKLVLDWTRDFMEFYKSDPYFAFIFLTRLTHDNVNKAGSADSMYSEFFRTLQNNTHLHNTIVLLFSDHGMRFGPLRETHLGKLEERLPFFYMLIPKAYQRLHKSEMYNLKQNQNRLTSPFDVYKTLLSLAKGEISESQIRRETPHGVNLFSAIPGERTCGQAGIAPHWCSCHQPRPVRVTDPVVIRAAQSITTLTNSRLQPVHHRCHSLALHHIQEALHLDPQPTTHNHSLYLITVVLSPGAGTFEATVQYDEDSHKFSVLGDPSRINAYGDQGKCIKQHSLQKYCVCVE